MSTAGRGLPGPAPLTPAITACRERGKSKLKCPQAVQGEELCFSCLNACSGSCVLLAVLGEQELMPALTPGEISLSKAERGSQRKLQRDEAWGIFCWQPSAVRSRCADTHGPSHAWYARGVQWIPRLSALPDGRNRRIR